MIHMPMLSNRCQIMQTTAAYAWEWDFYDALAAFLRIADYAQRHRASALTPWLPRAEGYLNVAFKHMPELSEYVFSEAATTRELAVQLRSAHLLRKANVLSGMWLKKQLVLECAKLYKHVGFKKLRDLLPGEMKIIALVAQSRGTSH